MKKIKIFACLLAFICFLPLPVLAFEPSGYVTDQANVIDQAVEDQIMTLNNQLEAKNGGQIFVVTVDFLDGQAIDDYAYHLFNDWGIGSAEYNNGVLLLLAIGEENYYCLQGSGLEYDLSSSSIKRILNDYLEDDFASGNYSDGVMKTVEALYEVVYATQGTPMYNDNPNTEYNPNYYPDEYYPNDYYYPDRSFSFFSGIFNLIFFFIIFAIIFSSIFAPRRRRGYYSRRPFIFFGSPHHHHHHYGPRPPFGGGSHFHGGGFHGGGGGSSHGGGFHGGGGGGSRGGGAGR